VDGVLGTRRWMDIVQLVSQLRQGSLPQPQFHLPEDVKTVGTDEKGALRASVAGASAYLKIADGCRRPCAFCAIPLIKGAAVSRPMSTILDEACRLQEAGVRELILIAQDTTDYGHDLGMKDGLAMLLEKLTRSVKEIDWIRIMYAYPGAVTDRLIDLMASQHQILPYLDMPLQHAHPKMLQRMSRPANMEWVYNTLGKLRHASPDLSIRTTFIVGYPGETQAEFQALLDFVQQTRFDRVGTFQFSYEDGTSSASLGDPVPAVVKQERYETLMELQQSISLQINQSYVGKTLDVLIEGFDQEISIGRSYRDAPEIDGLVLVEGQIAPGQIIPVRITGAMAYDLTGVPAVIKPNMLE
jgi:ribosomal protein S12 methylthiotransferase